MIDLASAIKIHELLIDEFGGSKGIRDQSLLESALSRPYQTFDGHYYIPQLLIRLQP